MHLFWFVLSGLGWFSIGRPLATGTEAARGQKDRINKMNRIQFAKSCNSFLNSREHVMRERMKLPNLTARGTSIRESMRLLPCSIRLKLLNRPNVFCILNRSFIFHRILRATCKTVSIMRTDPFTLSRRLSLRLRCVRPDDVTGQRRKTKRRNF